MVRSGPGSEPLAPPPQKTAPPTPKSSRRQAVLWEILGLAIVIVAGSLVLGGLYHLTTKKYVAIEKEKWEAEQNKPRKETHVVVKVLSPRTVVDRIRLPGVVSAWTKVRVPAEVAGQVIRTKSTPLDDGSQVKKDAPILHLDPDDYEIALQRAEAALTLAEQSFERTKNLFKEGATTRARFDADRSAFKNAQAAHAAAKLALDRTVIRSPIDGVIDDVLPEAGEYVRAGDEVAVLYRTGRVKVDVGIPEADIRAVRDLKTCEVTARSARDKPYEGDVIYLSHAPRRDALVYTLRLAVDNADGLLRPGMFVEARVVRAVREAGVMIPLFTTLPQEDRHVAYVAEEADGETVARRRVLTLGVILGNEAEVRAGLAPGDRLIVLGHRSVEDGTPVSVERTIKDYAELQR